MWFHGWSTDGAAHGRWAKRRRGPGRRERIRPVHAVRRIVVTDCPSSRSRRSRAPAILRVFPHDGRLYGMARLGLLLRSADALRGVPARTKPVRRRAVRRARSSRRGRCSAARRCSSSSPRSATTPERVMIDDHRCNWATGRRGSVAKPIEILTACERRERMSNSPRGAVDRRRRQGSGEAAARPGSVRGRRPDSFCSIRFAA